MEGEAEKIGDEGQSKMTDRTWMYRRLNEQGHLNEEFVMGVKSFIDFACSHPRFMDGEKIRCPCQKCKKKPFVVVETVKNHLLKNGFVLFPKYFNWHYHGEPYDLSLCDYNTQLSAAHNRRRGEHVAAQPAPAPTAGSVSHQTAFDESAKKSNHVSLYELFVYAHTRKHDGHTFINDKAKQVHERYQTLLQQKLSRGEIVDRDKLYYEVVGGHDKKGRVYGIGSMANMKFPFARPNGWFARANGASTSSASKHT